MTETVSNPQEIQPNAQDWSHVKDTVRMLNLAIAQIQTTLEDSGRSMDTLTKVFTEIGQHTVKLKNSAETENVPEEFLRTTQLFNDHLNEAICAFQFYDRLSQRLEHVSHGLEQTTTLMDDSDQLHTPEAWESIFNELSATYTMDCERLMFEHLSRGASVQEALEVYKHQFSEEDKTPDDTGDDIELF
ncbi:MAG: hypothetical protein K6L73_13800 [Cellvibrionaceae bacterium]